MMFRALRVVFALFLAQAGGDARAAIANGISSAAGATNSNQSGELFLNVWDAAAKTSYSLDLGVTVNQLLADPSGRTWVLDQRFKDFAATGNPLKFMVAANNTFGTLTSPGIGSVPSTYGWLASVRNVPTEIATAETWNNRGANAQVTAMNSVIGQRINYLNQNAVYQNYGIYPSNTPQIYNYTEQLSEVTDMNADNPDPFKSYFETLWGEYLGTKVNFLTTARVRSGDGEDQTLRLYFFGLTAPSVNKLKATDLGGGSQALALDVASARLVWGNGGDPGTGGGGSGGGTDGGSGGGGQTTPCALPWGGTLADGGSVAAYAADTAVDCGAVAETRVCQHGTLSGSNPFSACRNLAGCPLPWGGSLSPGGSVTAYASGSSSHCAAVAETRACTDGSLSGSYAFKSCTAPAGCNLPWGGTLANGQRVTAYRADTAANCQAVAETRTCILAVLTGSYTRPACDGPSLALLTPQGGQALRVGSKQVIAWSFNRLPAATTVAIAFSKNGGSTWKTLKSGLKIGRSYVWKPAASQLTASGKIRVCTVRSKSQDAICAQSETGFAVSR